jgi:HTH-type transcriptional regulator/antitoxin HigA
MDAVPGSDEADKLEVLTTLVELFEEEHFPIDLLDPITAIKFRMACPSRTCQQDLPAGSG